MKKRIDKIKKFLLLFSYALCYENEKEAIEKLLKCATLAEEINYLFNATKEEKEALKVHRDFSSKYYDLETRAFYTKIIEEDHAFREVEEAFLSLVCDVCDVLEEEAKKFDTHEEYALVHIRERLLYNFTFYYKNREFGKFIDEFFKLLTEEVVKLEEILDEELLDEVPF